MRILFALLSSAYLACAATWFVRPGPGPYGTQNGTSYTTAWNGLASVVWGGTGVVSGDILYICGTHVYTMTGGGFSSGQMNAVSGTTIRGDYTGDPGRVMCGARWQRTGETNWLGPDANGVYWNPTINNGLNFYELLFEVNGSTITRLNYKTNTTWVGALGSAAFIGNTNFVKTVSGAKPAGNLATLYYGWYFNLSGLSNVAFNGLTVTGPMFQNNTSALANNITFNSCTLSDNCLPFLATSNDYWTFNGCDVSYAKDGCIYAYDPAPTGAAYLTVTNCYLHDTDTGFYAGGDGHGIGVRGTATGHLLTHNTIERTETGIECFGGSQRDITVSYNTIRYTHANVTDGGGIEMSGSGLKTNAMIYGNVIYNLATNSSALYQGTGIGGGGEGNSLTILNNTIYNANVGIYQFRTGLLSCRILNNIIMNSRLYHVYSVQAGVTNCVMDYNLYYPGANKSDPLFDVFVDYPREDHSVFANPLLAVVPPVVLLDFRTRHGSPSMGAGVQDGLTFDIIGTPISQDYPPDIGAFQMTCASPVVP